MAATDTLDRAFMAAAAAAPYLSREDERVLAEQWVTGHDQNAMQRLVEAHMRLVVAMAQRFRHYGLSLADLVQEGHIGLLEAASRFDLAKDVRFSTYATWWIRAAIQDFVLKNWSMVRGGTSAGQKALFFNLRKLKQKLTRDNNLTQSEIHDAIATALGVAVADVAVMDARLAKADLSLNAPLTTAEDSGEFQDILPDEAHDIESEVQHHIDAQKRLHWLKRALGHLNSRERGIIMKRKMADEECTLDDLGRALGISKERVRQIETRALEKLKTALLRLNPEKAAYI